MDAATLIAAGAFFAAVCGGIAQIIVALNGRRQNEVVVRKLDGATDELAKIHPLVNSNMTRMFIVQGFLGLVIAALVWFGLKEAQKPKERMA